VIYGIVPLSHLVGVGLLLLIAPLAFHTDLLMAGGLTTLALAVVATWESIARRRTPGLPPLSS
jgi:low temperature requirement protein LtrA